MKSIALSLVGLVSLGTAVGGCAETQPEERPVTIIRPVEKEAPKGGIPPEKFAEIEQVFRQHNSSANKCYSDVLEEKHSRGFQGSVRVSVTLAPDGENSKATNVKILNSTLNDKQVQDCLVETIKGWDFPQLASGGEYSTQFNFRPAY